MIHFEKIPRVHQNKNREKMAVLNKIGSTGMVPVFYHKDAEVAKKVVKACYDGIKKTQSIGEFRERKHINSRL